MDKGGTVLAQVLTTHAVTSLEIARAGTRRFECIIRRRLEPYVIKGFGATPYAALLAASLRLKEKHEH